MKKFYSILATALISVCAFASKDVVPTDEVLADYYNPGQVCVCFFVPADMACNDIVLTGSFNGWKSTTAACIACEAVEGYDGWYVCSFEPEAEPDAEKGMQAKPVMLGGNGAFNWGYQVGAATAIRGGVQVVLGSYAGEIDLINYGADAPNVFTVDAWKQNPCTSIYHNYTFTVVSEGCDGYVVPFLVGEMTGWTFKQMQLDETKTMEYQVPTYSLNVKCAEGAPYQIVSGMMDETGEIAVQPGWKDEAYVQVLLDGEWVRLPGEAGDNLLTHEDANITLDLREDGIRWARCEKSSDEEYKFTFTVSCDEKYGKVHGTNGVYPWGTELTISAEGNYGYHFAEWSDRNTDNPRTIILKRNMNLTAIFAPNTYTISDKSNPAQGYIVGIGQYEYLTEVTLVATANYGYHFTQWSDGEKESSRKVTVTQDMAFMALFAPNKYTFSASCDEKYGKVVAANGEYDYLTQLAMTADANYGYHFVEWSDGNTENPRVLTLTKNTELTAIFAPNIYTISDNSNKEQGNIIGVGEYEYLTSVSVEATPVKGYQFTKWSDGNTDNPRTIEVTKDIELIALFDYQLTGNCGKDNVLTWTFDPSAMALNITGKGSLSDNYTYGTFIESLTIGNEVSVIGSEAFDEFAKLTNIIIGSSVKVLEERAFYNCPAIETITCYSQRPPTVNSNALYGLDYNTIVYVPADYLNNYLMHDAWGLYDVRPFGATTTTVEDDEVNVQPTSNTADVTWPAIENAATYELTIKDKNGNVICTLVFNAQGQLTSIAFAAPGRGQYAAQVAGFTFTVTGLDNGSSYSFTMEAKDSQGEVIDTKEGSFTTTESGIATALDNASLDSKPVKIIRNGQLFILRGDKTYTMQGQEVR